jgi:hypothetical protein
MHTLACACALLLAACVAPPAQPPRPGAGADTAPCGGGRQRMARIELYFGLSRRDGVVSEREFADFVDTQVTPRFPAGLTLLSGRGQFRDAGGALQVEGSRLLILMVPPNDAQADAKIDAIRDEYRRRFAQESVLRADGSACVSF